MVNDGYWIFEVTTSCHMGVNDTWEYPKNAGWFIIEIPIKTDDDWGYHYFRKPPYIILYQMGSKGAI